MTALKPIENRRVRAVASERYPLNKKCAHPECNEDAVDPHHAFPRSAIGGDSWFVSVEASRQELEAGPFIHHGFQWVGVLGSDTFTAIVPHVVGLCRAHHDDLEEHRAWVRLEDGEWRWYARVTERDEYDAVIEDGWALLGPLNPQPGSVEGKPKRRKFKGEKRRQRTTISIKVPKDEQEDGAGLWEEAITELESKLGYDPPRPVYFTIMDALNYTLLNAGPDDFQGGS